MKHTSTAALVLSLIAVIVALWSHKAHDPDKAADDALRRREAALMRHFEPSIRKMAADFAIEYPSDPQTIEEVFDPIIEMIKSVSETPGPGTQSHP